MNVIKAPLLIEVGTEELPPGNLCEISKEFSILLNESLQKIGFNIASAEYFSTPRRLAVRLDNIESKQPDRKIERKGPSLKAAFDAQGNATPAAVGFAKSCGIDVKSLEKSEDSKGNAWLFHTSMETGQPLETLLGPLVEDALNKLKFGKRMRWGNHEFSFARPIHWVCAMHGKTPVNFKVFNISTQSTSYGHRIHHPSAVKIIDAKYYEKALQEAFVIVDPTSRRQHITTESRKIAEKINGNVIFDDELLNIVANLVEWPVPLLCSFPSDFLEVPSEALISSMQNHQKCFPIRNQSAQLMPNFIAVSNLDTPPYTEIIRGNERVMQARLQDAAFFFEQDKHTSLADYAKRLDSVIFHKKLGSLHDKSMRISELAGYIATQIDAPVALCQRAALLAKADLQTQMVYEFPELQGIMGNHYAKYHGESEDVAQAIEQAYWPKFANDQLPEKPTAICLALADRLDTLVGIFGIGLTPTGEKDPFALRRAAIAILRIIIEKNLNVDLCALLEKALNGYGSLVKPNVLPHIMTFCLERFKALYAEKGISPQVLEAVLSKSLTKPTDIHQRIMAVNEFLSLPEAQSLAQANKRVQNILTKSGIALNTHELPQIDDSLLVEAAEKELAKQLQLLEKTISPLLEQKNYEKPLKLLAKLRDPVDAFFDQVMVMAEDPNLKRNRINLVTHLSAIFLKIADISRLAL